MTSVAVIGAGQAGLSASYRLTERGIDHVVLESGEIGQTWRTRRWRSFRLVSPNRLNLLPGGEYDGPEPDAFLATEGVVDYLGSYARSFEAPVVRGTTVRAIRLRDDGRFRLEHHSGALGVRAVIVATGAFGHPWIPELSTALPRSVLQIHNDAYWSPESLPRGGVLIVGSGQSGCQIADELVLAGRDVWLAVGRFGWVPRRPYGRDQMMWRLDMGDFARVVNDPDAPDLTYPFTPMARWGTSDFHVRTLVDDGVRLLGHVRGASEDRLLLADDLAETLAAADTYATEFVARVWRFARTHDADVGADPPVLDCWSDRAVPSSPTSLVVSRAGIGTVIWATGYRQDFSWILAPTFAPNGSPYQRQGISKVPGLAFMGLHRMHGGGSGTLLGVGPDSENVVGVIADLLGA